MIEIECNTLIVKSSVKRNGISLVLCGALLLAISLFLFLTNQELFIFVMVSFTLGLLSLIVGGCKCLEPPVKMRLSSKGINYIHRHGEICVDWDNIQRIDRVRISLSGEIIELPYIGIKLKKVNPVLDSINLRLARTWLSEQRSLLLIDDSDNIMQDLEAQFEIEFTPLLVMRNRYHGLIAMFGHRIIYLNNTLGYHLYLSVEDFEFSPEDVLSILKFFHSDSNKSAII